MLRQRAWLYTTVGVATPAPCSLKRRDNSSIQSCFSRRELQEKGVSSYTIAFNPLHQFCGEFFRLLDVHPNTPKQQGASRHKTGSRRRQGRRARMTSPRRRHACCYLGGLPADPSVAKFRSTSGGACPSSEALGEAPPATAPPPPLPPASGSLPPSSSKRREP